MPPSCMYTEETNVWAIVDLLCDYYDVFTYSLIHKTLFRQENLYFRQKQLFILFIQKNLRKRVVGNIFDICLFYFS